MITELRRVKAITPPDRDAWAFPHIWLFALRQDLPVGALYPVYEKASVPDFMCEKVDPGEVAALRSVTVVAPGGHVRVHNDMLPEPTEWAGSLNPVCNGVFIAASTYFEATVPTQMHCMSPPLNWHNFKDKDLRREFVEAGQTIHFRPNDIGFGVVWGENAFNGYSVDPGDSLTVNQDTVLAVVSRKPEADE